MRLPLLILVLFLTACATPQKIALPCINASAAQKPKKVLLLPVDIDVMETPAYGVPKKVAAWSEQANSIVKQSLRKTLGTGQNFELIEMPETAASEKDVLEQYGALYGVVGRDAFNFGCSQDPIWRHKRKNFDYTLGNGLDFLRQKTGADAALFVMGQDRVLTGGNIANEFLHIMVTGRAAARYVPVIFVSVGLVDLESGNILWLNSINGDNLNLRNQADTDRLVANIFRDYPVAK